MKESLQGICSGEDPLHAKLFALFFNNNFRKILAEMDDEDVGAMMKVSRNWNTMLKQESNGIFAKMFKTSFNS